MDKKIIGYGGGGGGKGGGGNASITIAPDSLASRSYAQVLDLICEGEIEGLTNGYQSVYLDSTPLQNPDGSFNFSGVSFTSVNGTPNQNYIPGFTDVENEVSVGVEVRQSAAVVRAITNTNIDHIRVRINVPQLSLQSLSDGSITGTAVSLAIDLQNTGGAYYQMVLDIINGKATNQYERDYTIPLIGSGPWNIRVRRITPDSTQTNLVNRFLWQSYTEIVSARLSYPNSALAALRVDAAQFQAIPTRAYDVKMLRIQVPSNYDPIARTYTGTWDGTFKTAWSDNPAWCFYDMLTNKRYGLGQFISASQVDKWSLYNIAQYCDQLVPDGFGGTEPRFTCNLYLQQSNSAFQVVQDMAAIFRGMAYWASGSVSVSQDSPSDPVALFTNANVVDGNFSYSGSSLKSRHTVALVTWNNMADLCKPYVEYVQDEDGIKKYGIVLTRVTALGCTSRGQAHRLGRWLLYSERLETESVLFRSGLEGAAITPGVIIKVADQVRAGQRLGGRIASATTGSITIDSPLVDGNGAAVNAVGATISVVTMNGAVQTTTISAQTGNTLTLATSLPSAPQNNALWIIELPTISAQLFRVVQITEAEPGQYEITAVAHNPSKYGYIENNLTLESRSITTLKTDVSPPGSVSISQNLYKYQAAVLVQATFSWPSVSGAIGYRVGWSVDGGNFTFDNVTANEYDIFNASAGSYTVRVWSIGPAGQIGTLYTEATQTLLGKTAPPSDVANFRYGYDQSTGVILAWDAVPDLDLQCYEIRKGVDWNTGALVGQYSVTTHGMGVQNAAGTYWIKALDTSGSYSTNAASVIVSASVAPTPTMSAVISGGNVVLSWNAVVGSLAIDHYEVRYGTTWSTATVVTTTKGTTYTVPAPSGGNFTWLVAAVDIAGNYGGIGSVTATINVPNAPNSIRADVVDNNALVYWSPPSPIILPIDHYEVRKGSTWATATLIGKTAGTFTAVFEQVAGVFTYWIAAVDTAGNYGTPGSVSATINQPPDYILRANINSTFSGTISNFMVDNGTLLGPFDTTQTFSGHFTSNSWSSPQDQINAGYPLYLEPDAPTGSYTETIDYGSVLPATTIVATLTSQIIVGSVSISCQIAYKQNSTDPWTYATAGSTSALASNFRYVQVTYSFSSPGGQNLLRVTGLNIKLSIKQRLDGGSGSAAIGGTAVNFNYPFIEADTPSVQPQGTSPLIPVVIYSGVPNPTGFTVKIYNLSGTEVGGPFSWNVRGY